MTDVSDWELLERFVQSASEPAFAALVERHLPVVYSVAWRQTADAQQAQDITQAVFIILARRAATLKRRVVLSGWLYQTARLTAANWQRAQASRLRREQQAFMQSQLTSNEADTVWGELSPQLEPAMARLAARDRDALVLRYFQNRSMADVGAALGWSENTAQKRVGRALEKLRKFFANQGIALSASTLAASLGTKGIHAVPSGMAAKISAVVTTNGAAASTSALTLAKGAVKIMAWTKTKAALVAGAVILLAAGTTTIVWTKGHPSSSQSEYEAIFQHPDASSLRKLETLAPILIVRPSRYPDKAEGIWSPKAQGVFVGADLSDLLAWAYGADPIRVILPDGYLDGKYDYLNTERNGEAALRELLKKQPGLVAHRETRPADVIILGVRDPQQLNSFRSRGGEFACYSTTKGNMEFRYFTNAPLTFLGDQEVSGYFRKPCIVRAGPKAKYDFSLRWETPKGLTGEARRAAIRPVLEQEINQLGLELTPSRESIEMLVVEQTDQR
jgi:uncharacterized protein (TIGR03435 family)